MVTATLEKTFAALSLKPTTLSSLDAKGYRTPTEVQFETIPKALAGHDLVVQSRTGTGKTAAYGIPIVEQIDTARGEVQALVLTPTRELAIQVTQEISELGRDTGVKVESVYGGDSLERQIEGIRAGAQVIVGTPGRVLDHLRRRTLSFRSLRTLVLDEADRMLDLGFAQEMSQIMEYLPEERQTLLFSATVPVSIRGLIYHYLADPEWVLLSGDQVYVREVEHLYCLTTRLHKEATLERILEYEKPASSMIFCNTKEETRRVFGYLASRGHRAAMLSSDLTQKKRESVLQGFRDGRAHHLVTTDVASRGIDIEDLSHVFIFSTPESPEQYIHRAGRTGRVGKTGRAISLVSAHDLMNFNRLVRRYRIEVKELQAPTDEEVRARKAQRIVEDVAADAALLPLETFFELAPAARGVVSREDRDRIVVLLLNKYLAATAPPPEPGDDVEAEGPEPPLPGSQSGGPRRSRRPRRGFRR